jgi:hypothetical protein
MKKRGKEKGAKKNEKHRDGSHKQMISNGGRFKLVFAERSRQ